MIEEIKKDALEKGVPIIKDEGLAFLLNFIEQHKLKDILELGTAVGYSAIMMAQSDDEIRIEFNGSQGPCIIVPVEGNSYLYLILPIRR